MATQTIFRAVPVLADGKECTRDPRMVQGKYATVKNYIRFCLSVDGEQGMAYNIWANKGSGNWKQVHQYSVPGMMFPHNRSTYLGRKVKLDGNDAIITASHDERFAFLYPVDGSQRAEFAWSTIAWVIATKKGEFKS